MKNSFLKKFVLMSFALFLVLCFVGSAIIRRPRVFMAFVRPLELWIVDPNGNVTNTNTNDPLPFRWGEFEISQTPNSLTLMPGSGIQNLVGVERIDGGAHPVFYVFRRKGRDLGSALIIAASIFPPFGAIYAFFTGFFLLLYIRRNATLAESVLSDLRKGNLKSRFPITQLDEAGRLMRQFNAMADEIESLVEKLKHAERSRTELLKELAHDLRTPLTAVTFHLETVADLAPSLSTEEIQNKMEISIGEMQYFKRLLEDLFLLSQIGEPGYQPNRTTIEMEALAKEVVSRAEDVLEMRGKKIAFEIHNQTPRAAFEGDPVLVRRLFQNAIQNAADHAVKQVRIHLESTAEGWAIRIQDDGPGFTKESLANFGKRRSGRFLDASHKHKVSLGLGSVILFKIAALYGGTVTATNRLDDTGSISGADIRILLPPAVAQVSQLRAA